MFQKITTLTNSNSNQQKFTTIIYYNNANRFFKIKKGDTYKEMFLSQPFSISSKDEEADILSL